MMEGIENWLSETVGLCIVIGTSGTLYLAAEYTFLFVSPTVANWRVEFNKYARDVRDLGGKAR